MPGRGLQLALACLSVWATTSATPIRPVFFEDGLPTESSVVHRPVKGQVLWDDSMKLDRSKLNVFVLSAFCPFVCMWVPEFINKTGIDVAVHCWERDRERAAGHASAVDDDITLHDQWKICEPFGGNLYVTHEWDMHKADGTQGFLGGMDVQFQTFGASSLLPAKNDWCCEHDWTARPEDVKTDLTPFLTQSDFDWLSVLPALRDFFCTSGQSVTALPMDIDALAMMHQDKHVNLPPVATWQELVTELRRLADIDRDGDGAADKPFCSRGGYTGGLGRQRLIFYIATSFLQVRGQFDTTSIDLKNLESLQVLAGWQEAASIFVDIKNLEYQGVNEGEAYKNGKLCVGCWGAIVRLCPCCVSWD